MGPNPRVVLIAIAELGAEVELEAVDLMAGENRQDAHLARNPSGQLPTLQLDDDSYLAEVTAIVEYLDEKSSGTLIGSTAEERAVTRMWVRRIDLNICENLGAGFRYAEGLALFKDRIYCIPHAADDFKAITQDKLTWLDGLMGDKEFICGDRFTLADILLFAFLEFGSNIGQPLDAKCERLQAWYTRVASRASAAT
jgi:glutathione S-transferase